nr:hypothetical protein [Tanacetum cinerariifolium]
VYNIVKTSIPQHRSNTKSDRDPSASKSSCIKNNKVKVEEHHRNLLLSKNKKHMSSECNNIKLAIQNDKYKVVYAMCKQCFITANHDIYVLNYVNDMNYHVDNQNAKVSNTTNQKKHKAKVNKSKKLGSKEKLDSPKPRKPKTCLRWSPTGRIFNVSGKLIKSSYSECQSDSFKGDNACASNPQEPTKASPASHEFMWSDESRKYKWEASIQPKDKEDHGDNECHFDELSAMAFEQHSSNLGLQGMTSGHISSRLTLTYAP